MTAAEDHLIKIRRLFTAHRFSKSLLFNTGIMIPFLLSVGLRPSDTGAVASAYWVVYGLAQLPTGLLADWFGPGLVLVAGASIAGISMICFGFSTHLWQFVTFNVFTAFGQAMISGSDSSILRRELQSCGLPDRYRSVEFSGSFGRNVALLVASGLSTVLVSHLGYSSLYILSGVSITASGLMMVTLRAGAPRIDTRVPQRALAPDRKSLLSKLGSITMNGKIVTFSIALALDVSAVNFLQLLLTDLGSRPYVFPLLFGIQNGIAVLFFFMRKVQGFPELNTRGMFFVYLFACLILAVSTSVPRVLAVYVIAIAVTFFGVYKAVYYPNARSDLVDAVPAGENTTVLSLASMIAGVAASGQAYVVLDLGSSGGPLAAVIESMILAGAALVLRRIAHLAR